MDIQDQGAQGATLGDDLLPGVAAIAEYLAQPESVTGYQIRQGYWGDAVFYVGKRVFGRKSRLRARANGPSERTITNKT
jgi:hypothetical protein